ncbi:MAG: hypothetical protein DRO23_09030 [Thermoprotei archaeon]|nr:MAG: hypothetical protein DRO23_09030 [Thermoprotei archaeon]
MYYVEIPTTYKPEPSYHERTVLVRTIEAEKSIDQPVHLLDVIHDRPSKGMCKHSHHLKETKHQNIFFNY